MKGIYLYYVLVVMILSGVLLVVPMYVDIGNDELGVDEYYVMLLHERLLDTDGYVAISYFDHNTGEVDMKIIGVDEILYSKLDSRVDSVCYNRFITYSGHYVPSELFKDKLLSRLYEGIGLKFGEKVVGVEICE